ncbi:MAG: response regulator transcription factor, partial [Chlorobiales bacterium]|nr:response regulator transcription factor [Chlorobiales bacterium]
MKTRILLVDDHKIVREGLRALLDSQDEFEVISEASDGRTAVRLALEKKPDIVLMDIAMPQLNGIEATRQIVSAKSSSKVIALSMHLDKEWVSEVFLAGASGYLLKDCEFEELKRAIKTVLLNRYYLSPDVADDVIKDYIGARLERIAGAPTLS